MLQGRRSKKSRPLLALVARLRALVAQNTVFTVVAAVAIVQLPFTVMFFFGGSRSIAVHAESRQPAGTRASAAYAGTREKSREDPFAALPDAENEKPRNALMVNGGAPRIMGFRGEAAPADSPKPDLEKIEHAKSEIPPLPVFAVASQPSRSAAADAQKLPGMTLTGVVRYRGKSVAIFRVQDSNAVYTAEGERIAGTECHVETISPTKVLVRRQTGHKTERSWFFVGEQSRA